MAKNHWKTTTKINGEESSRNHGVFDRLPVGTDRAKLRRLVEMMSALFSPLASSLRPQIASCNFQNFHATGKGSRNCITAIGGTQEMYTRNVNIFILSEIKSRYTEGGKE